MKKFINPDWKVLRDLTPNLRQAWFYMWDKADAAGVYEHDSAYFEADLKEKISFETLVNIPGIVAISPGKLLIENYIEVNVSGVLKSGYNPHKPIFRAIEKHGASFFCGLGIFVESGFKDQKEQKPLFEYFGLDKDFKLAASLAQACRKLEDEEGDEDKDKDEKRKGVLGEKQKTQRLPSEKLFPRFIEIWTKWFVEKTNVKPEIKALDGKAAKSLIAYFRDMRPEKGPATDEQILDTWEFMLKNWDRLDQFHQSQITMQQIYSRINNIITQIKQNGQSGFAKNKWGNSQTGVASGNLIQDALNASRKLHGDPPKLFSEGSG